MTGPVERGQRAGQLLDNEIFRDVLQGLEKAYTEAWLAARTVDAREDCHRYMTILGKLPEDIRSIANTGNLEQLRRKELEGQKKGIIPWPKMG